MPNKLGLPYAFICFTPPTEAAVCKATRRIADDWHKQDGKRPAYLEPAGMLQPQAHPKSARPMRSLRRSRAIDPRRRPLRSTANIKTLQGNKMARLATIINRQADTDCLSYSAAAGQLHKALREQ